MSDKKWPDRPFTEYLAAAASNAPAPGGGSVAAAAAALGSSLVAMVGNFTVGKKKFKEVEAEAQAIVDKEKEIRGRLAELVHQDTEVYTVVSKAYTLPRETDEDKAIRKEEIQKALKIALTVPEEIAQLCYDAIKLSEQILKIGNPNLISDVGVAACLASAALESAWLNVQINLSGIKDEDYVEKKRGTVDPLIEEGRNIAMEVWNEVVKQVVKH